MFRASNRAALFSRTLAVEGIGDTHKTLCNDTAALVPAALVDSTLLPSCRCSSAQVSSEFRVVSKRFRKKERFRIGLHAREAAPESNS